MAGYHSPAGSQSTGVCLKGSRRRIGGGFRQVVQIAALQDVATRLGTRDQERAIEGRNFLRTSGKRWVRPLQNRG